MRPESEEGSRHPVSPLGNPLGFRRIDFDAGGPDLVHRLFGRCLRHRLYRYENAALGFGTELDATGGQRE